jgi:hypothetical protein
MNVRMLVAAGAVLALTAGPGAPPAAAQQGLCTQPNQHCITVTVAPGGQPKISVDIPELRVAGKNHVIFWSLKNAAGQSYRFPENGIAFKTDAGRKEFGCAPMGNTGTVFRCTDPNDTQGRFEYAVRLGGSPAVPVLDPWIINQ